MISPEDTAALLELISRKIDNISTSIPALVTKYNSAKQVVDVEIVVKRPYSGSNNDPTDQPIRLGDVPVIFPQGSDWVIAGPLKKGDAVNLHFSMFDCDNWMVGDKKRIYQAGSRYYHDLNSAFATPGAFTYSSPTRDSRFKDKFHIVQGGNYVTLEEGKVVIECQGGQSRITLEGGTVTIDATHTQVNSPTTTMDGDLTVTGVINSPSIVADTNLAVSGITMQTHVHPPGTVPPSNP